jgi:hypothetical protein
MNHCELQALRKMLMIDVSEAAQHIGKVSPRTWQYWESERYRIPDDVKLLMKDLVEKRKVLIEKLKNACTTALKSNQSYALPYYRMFEDFQHKHSSDDVIAWRIHQSAAAAIFSELNISLTDEKNT